MNGVRFFVENNFAYDGVSVYVFEDRDGKRAFGKLVMTVSEEATIAERTTVLRRNSAQELIDNLWQCGFRPTNGIGSAGALEAVQEHNKTLKDISNRLLKIIEDDKP